MVNIMQVIAVKDSVCHADENGNNFIDMEVKVGGKIVELKDLKTMKNEFLGRVYKFFGAAIETESGKFVKKDVFFGKLSNVCAREILKKNYDKFNENDVNWLAGNIETELKGEKKFSTRDGKLSEAKVQPLWNKIMTIEKEVEDTKTKSKKEVVREKMWQEKIIPHFSKKDDVKENNDIPTTQAIIKEKDKK